MPYLLIRHTVGNHCTWPLSFGGHASLREAAGCLGGQLFHVADDRTEVVVLFEWDSLENARAFAESADLAERMRWVGVVGDPEFTFLEKLSDVPV